MDDIFGHFNIIQYFSKYDKHTFVNDGAVLILKDSFTFSRYVRPACLPPHLFKPEPNSNCIISGWGKIAEGGSNADLLRWTAVPIVDSKKCKTKLEKAMKRNLDDRFNAPVLCAGGKRADACQGDSGGPLVCNVEGRATLVGGTSWGKGCGRTPGIYSDVGQLLPWVTATINKWVN